MDKQILIPILVSTLAGLGTVIGGLLVYVNFKDREGFISFALSFSLSVMIALSVFELIPESMIIVFKRFNFILSVIIGAGAFLIGYLLVNAINKKSALLPKDNLYRVGVLSMIALMIHNFPEGIATFMSTYNDIGTGLNLAIAILMHNIPEGIAISVPIYYSTNSKKRGVVYSLISSLAEPLGAIIAYVLLRNHINELSISIVLIIVAGIMITLSINELFPESIKYNKRKENTIGLITGLILVIINLFIL